MHSTNLLNEQWQMCVCEGDRWIERADRNRTRYRKIEWNGEWDEWKRAKARERGTDCRQKKKNCICDPRRLEIDEQKIVHSSVLSVSFIPNYLYFCYFTPNNRFRISIGNRKQSISYLNSLEICFHTANEECCTLWILNGMKIHFLIPNKKMDLGFCSLIHFQIEYMIESSIDTGKKV